jgi:hypothetical protein
MLSESLRDEFYAYINANIIKNCKVFEIYDSHLLTQITRVLESETYAPGDTHEVFEVYLNIIDPELFGYLNENAIEPHLFLL